MAIAEGLMGLGVPAELALRTGWALVIIATSTAGQGAGQITGKGNKIVLATPTDADDAVTLPPQADLGDEIIIVNMDAADSLDVFPPSGHSIHKLAADGGTPVATGQSLHVVKVSATLWVGRLVATPAAT